MRFKVGDKVRVRNDLLTGEEYYDGYFYFTEKMKKFKGEIVTIAKINRISRSYDILEDNSVFAWVDEMFELIEKGEKNNMNIEELNKEYKDKMDALMEEYKEKAKKLTEKKEELFIEEGQDYFYVDYDFAVEEDRYCKGDGTDNRLLKYGNMYPYTDENKDKIFKEVSLIAERRKLQSEMELFARLNNEGEIDWNDMNQRKWSIDIYLNDKCIEANPDRYYKDLNTTYFTSKEIAEKALDKFGDRIKELYLKEGEIQ